MPNILDFILDRFKGSSELPGQLMATRRAKGAAKKSEQDLAKSIIRQYPQQMDTGEISEEGFDVRLPPKFYPPPPAEGDVVQLPTPMPTPKKGQLPKHAQAVYEVQPGETLNQIGDYWGVPWKELASYNKIKNPDLIYPGQIIYIPKLV